MKKLALFAIVALFLTSCYNTRLFVGDVNYNEPMKQVNKVGWTHHFILGLVPGKNANANPAEYLPAGQQNYMVRTNQSFLNGLVGSLTFGIYTPTQVTYYVPVK
jgi:hypothetical protein